MSAERKGKRKFKRFLAVIAVVLAAFVAACGIYVNIYYHADETAFQALESGSEVTVRELEGEGWVFEPADAKTGWIFYPGGKVETESYAPLMHACAEEGILCVLMDMPFRLAVFDADAAAGIPEQFPGIEHWYLGGHSLGGSMAASYLEKHAAEYEGLILLASYSTADLSGANLRALSIYGSEDGVLNRENYEKYKSNLPADLTEQVIDGGCHAYFGDYGPQKGDGTAYISGEEQIRITAERIAEFCGTSFHLPAGEI